MSKRFHIENIERIFPDFTIITYGEKKLNTFHETERTWDNTDGKNEIAVHAIMLSKIVLFTSAVFFKAFRINLFSSATCPSIFSTGKRYTLISHQIR